MNGQYLAPCPPEAFAAPGAPRLEAAGLWRRLAGTAAWLAVVLALLQPRAKRSRTSSRRAGPSSIPANELPYDPQAAAKHLKGESFPRPWRRCASACGRALDWTAAALEAALRETAERVGMPRGSSSTPTRLAVTGRARAPASSRSLELLGRERSLARLDRLQDHLRAGLPRPLTLRKRLLSSRALPLWGVVQR